MKTLNYLLLLVFVACRVATRARPEFILCGPFAEG